MWINLLACGCCVPTHQYFPTFLESNNPTSNHTGDKTSNQIFSDFKFKEGKMSETERESLFSCTHVANRK